MSQNQGTEEEEEDGKCEKRIEILKDELKRKTRNLHSQN